MKRNLSKGDRVELTKGDKFPSPPGLPRLSINDLRMGTVTGISKNGSVRVRLDGSKYIYVFKEKDLIRTEVQ